jgi:hypothetical protein
MTTEHTQAALTPASNSGSRYLDHLKCDTAEHPPTAKSNQASMLGFNWTLVQPDELEWLANLNDIVP